MKKLLTFIPLGVGISAAIIYVFNVISFRAINNTVAMGQILANLRIYLYISIIAFIVYAIMKIILYVKFRNVKEPKVYVPKEKVEKVKIKNNKKKVEVVEEKNTYVPNYDYVPLYKDEVKTEEVKETKIGVKEPEELTIDSVAYEPFDEVTTPYVKAESKKEEKVSIFKSYCPRCGKEVYSDDVYCRSCGYNLSKNKKRLSPFVRKVINIIEIIIMILIIYFILNMLVDYKSKINPNFKSPFNITMTK